MEILLVEPYYAGSHRAWVDGYARFSHHTVRVLSLPGRFWKWRMHGGAVTLARRFRETACSPDLILATDMLDLTTFLALTRDQTHKVPVAVYFHENQLTYPMRRGERRDLHYGFINYASALLADVVFFNSSYHLESFLDELPRLLKHFPDYNEPSTVTAIRAKSEVLPLGLDLRRHDGHQGSHPYSDVPTIVWNHRWEYDKNPQGFFKAVYALKGMGLQFNLVLLGESFRVKPEEFIEARSRLASEVIHYGYAEDFAAYSAWLWRGDLCISTARHEFFGTGMAEAIYCGCYPLLPNRLGYPELIPEYLHPNCLYDDFAGLIDRVRDYLVGQRPPAPDLEALRTRVAGFDWSEMIVHYDRRLEEIANR